MNAAVETEKDLDLTEIINGEEVMSPSPFRKHQIISANLFRKIDRYVEQNGLGRVYYSPLDVIFEDGMNRFQPDLFFVRKENMAIEQDWIRGVPDMVCEIVSTYTFRLDTDTKKEIYEKYGVPEYWIVIPDLRIIEVLTLDNAKYKISSYAEGEGTVTSAIIGGLDVNSLDIFE
ncbi:MAG: Uma2 family endonuclease [Candidatus Magnetominusculus sp. LBB02]|nr:Uma2 family endonuclease [Candidatus Magnetominusculus sp. LBB02]